MKKTLFFLAAISILIGCSDDDSSSTSKLDLLTGGSQKSWYVYDTSDDDPCPSTADDAWTFFADGTLAYDHGTVTESNEDQCSDLVNFEGEWEFSSNETELTIVALKNADTDEELNFTIVSGDITTLTEDRLVISVDSDFVEFRKK